MMLYKLIPCAPAREVHISLWQSVAATCNRRIRSWHCSHSCLTEQLSTLNERIYFVSLHIYQNPSFARRVSHSPSLPQSCHPTLSLPSSPYSLFPTRLSKSGFRLLALFLGSRFWPFS